MLTHQFLGDYKKYGLCCYIKIASAHLRGWSYNDWVISDVNKTNCRTYLSTLQYCLMHPFNAEYSSWIDDKLTLKYILAGTAAGKYMPDYYYQISAKGRIEPLMDCPGRLKSKGAEGIIELLKAKQDLALKLIKGSLGKGFYHICMSDGDISVNGQVMDDCRFTAFINSLRGYIVTQYLKPHSSIARYNNRTPGCLRYILGRKKNGEWTNVYTFMRIGTVASGNVENFNAGGVLMEIDRHGGYDGGLVLANGGVRPVAVDMHPDSDAPLKGVIPMWNEVKEAARKVVAVMPQLTYAGFDFCITDNSEVKIIEINSLTSLDCMQTRRSILDYPGGQFFRELL